MKHEAWGMGQRAWGKGLKSQDSRPFKFGIRDAEVGKGKE
jgi:hypothetical protein